MIITKPSFANGERERMKKKELVGKGEKEYGKHTIKEKVNKN